MGAFDDRPGLLMALEAAVPLEIHRVRDWSWEWRQRTAADVGEVIAYEGDTLMYGGKSGDAARVFNRLARGLACGACQPGGVTFAGLHWCAWSHPWCPSRGMARPQCCTCPASCRLWQRHGAEGPEGECLRECWWCRFGCAAASGERCCAEAEEDDGWRRTETVRVAGDVL